MSIMNDINSFVHAFGEALIVKAVQENDVVFLRELRAESEQAMELAIKITEEKYSFEKWREATIKANQESKFNEWDKSGRFTHYHRLLCVADLRRYYEENVMSSYQVDIEHARLFKDVMLLNIDGLLDRCYKQRRSTMRLVS